MNKKDLRNFVRMQKGQFSGNELRELSLPVMRRLMAHPRIKNASVILMYYSLDDEVFTHETLERLVAEGKEVLLPAVVDDSHMELRRYRGPQDLQGGFFNIMEPIGEVFNEYERIDVAVVPGMAFDSRNNRLGRGRGYYDRLLAQLPHTYKIGVCFDFQRLPGVPTEANDQPMDEVI